MISALSRLHVGYVPYSADLMHAGDRRRFVHYARKRNISFEVASPDRSYDVVILSCAADPTVWSRFSRQNGKLVFELIDSYFAESPRSVRSLTRGPAKYIVGQAKHLRLNYADALRDLCRRADAVVCSTEEQRSEILKLCPNVLPILDYHAVALGRVKSSYHVDEQIHLVWEGQPANVATFDAIREPLRRLAARRRIAVHLITDLTYSSALRTFGRRSTVDLAKRVIPVRDQFLYAWNERTLSAIATQCDLGVIPIPLDQPMFAAKPENKLLLLWRMGIPVVASATLAYRRTMHDADVEGLCSGASEWLTTIERFAGDEELRRESAERGRAFVERTQSEEAFLHRYDQLFASLGYEC